MLTDTEIVKLKVALYHDAVKYDYVAKGFQVYAKFGGKVRPVPTVGKPCREMIWHYQITHKLKTTGLFDAATRASLIPVVDVSSGQKVADAALKLAKLSPRHYTQARPAPMTVQGFIDRGSDCSAFAILCYHEAGLPDPNGTNYSGYGYTGSLILRGTSVSQFHLSPGDLIFYGPSSFSTEHVTVYVGNGLVVSHGHEGGPLILPLHYRDDYVAARRYV